MAGIRHAERAVDEHFKLAIGLGADGADLVEGQLARHHDAADAETLREADAIGAGDAHLRAAVDFEAGRDLPREFHDAKVLDDDGIGASLGDGCEGARRLLDFGIEEKRVESDVSLDAAPVQGAHGLR